MDKGLTVPKWVLGAENTPNAPELFCPSPKVLDFNKKASLGVRSPCFKVKRSEYHKLALQAIFMLKRQKKAACFCMNFKLVQYEYRLQICTIFNNIKYVQNSKHSF